MNDFTLCFRVFLVFILFGGSGCSASEREFTVVAYNVENLFDLDGIAIYKDYTQDELDDPFTYGRRKLLTKLQNTAAVLKTINAGVGPEVILFQELEADFTPESSVGDLNAFLDQHRGVSVEQMLMTDWQEEYAGLPAEAWLLKALNDEGLAGYSVVVAPSKGEDAGIAHTNAVFSRFPIQEVQCHELEQARDILEVTLDVEGHPLTVYVNHWKSGASSPAREPIRAQNATVLRALIDARLAVNPMADLIIGGDLNSHYNHSILYPDVETGINDVLGSQGDELAIRELGGVDLYNLWFELSPEQRYSEVWKGRRGTLMHMLITRGLYDHSGVRYVDGSFQPLICPGLNADPLGRPLEWSFAGDTGGGASDHFPVAARFTVGSGRAGEFVELENPSAGDDALDFEMPLGYKTGMDLILEDGAPLAEIADEDLGPLIGRLYRVEARVLKLRPMTLEVAGRQWQAYAPDKSVYAQLKELKGAEVPTAMVVKLGIWKGQRQFVVEGLESFER
jgi:endonuclease/exonuclease/phosphatase family metal-dependent hydrolase